MIKLPLKRQFKVLTLSTSLQRQRQTESAHECTYSNQGNLRDSITQRLHEKWRVRWAWRPAQVCRGGSGNLMNERSLVFGFSRWWQETIAVKRVGRLRLLTWATPTDEHMIDEWMNERANKPLALGALGSHKLWNAYRCSGLVLSWAVHPCV